jgi:hypothetical protein
MGGYRPRFAGRHIRASRKNAVMRKVLPSNEALRYLRIEPGEAPRDIVQRETLDTVSKIHRALY